jgi:hypothetical protein
MLSLTFVTQNRNRLERRLINCSGERMSAIGYERTCWSLRSSKGTNSGFCGLDHPDKREVVGCGGPKPPLPN